MRKLLIILLLFVCIVACSQEHVFHLSDTSKTRNCCSIIYGLQDTQSGSRPLKIQGGKLGNIDYGVIDVLNPNDLYYTDSVGTRKYIINPACTMKHKHKHSTNVRHLPLDTYYSDGFSIHSTDLEYKKVVRAFKQAFKEAFQLSLINPGVVSTMEFDRLPLVTDYITNQ